MKRLGVHPEHIVWPVDGPPTSLGRDPDLRTLQKTVGGYIEGVLCPDGSFLWVNEDGQRLNLRVNVGASLVAGQRILGTVVWCAERPVDDEEDEEDE